MSGTSRTKFILLVAALCAFAAHDARAADPDAVRADSVAAIRLMNGAQAKTIDLLGYYNPGDGGGGKFARDTSGFCTEDDGILCIADKVLPTPHFFRRVEFTGSLLECGLKPHLYGDGTDVGNSALLTACFTAMQRLNKTTLRVEGNASGSRYYLDTGFQPPIGTGFSCPSNTTVGDVNEADPEDPPDIESRGDVNATSYTFVVPPGTSQNSHASFWQGACTVVQAGLEIPVGGFTEAGGVSALYHTQQLMTGIGIKVTGDEVSFGDLRVFGFFDGISSSGNTNLVFGKNVIDSHRCLLIQKVQLGGVDLGTLRCDPTPLAQQYTNFALQVSLLADNGSGRIRGTLKTPCVISTNMCPEVGWIVWIADPTGMSSARYRHVITALVTSGGSVTHFDINARSTPTGTWSGTTTAGSDIVTGVTSTSSAAITDVEAGTPEGGAKRVRFTIASTASMIEYEFACVTGITDSGGDESTTEGNQCGYIHLVDGSTTKFEFFNSLFVTDYEPGSGGTVTWGWPMPHMNVAGTGSFPSGYIKYTSWQSQTFQLSVPATVSETVTLTFTDRAWGLTVTSVVACATAPTSEACVTVTPDTRDIPDKVGTAVITIAGAGCGANGEWDSPDIEADGTVRLPGSTFSGSCASVSGTAYMGALGLNGTQRYSDIVRLRDTTSVSASMIQGKQHDNGIVGDKGSSSAVFNSVFINQQDFLQDILWTGIWIRINAKSYNFNGGTLQVGPCGICVDANAGSTPVVSTFNNISFQGTNNVGPNATIARLGGSAANVNINGAGSQAPGAVYIGGPTVGEASGERAIQINGSSLRKTSLIFQGIDEQNIFTGFGSRFKDIQPNMVRLGDCVTNVSETSLAMPLYNCGFTGMASAAYLADTSPTDGSNLGTQATAKAITTPLAYLTSVPDDGDGFLLTDADGSGKCHYVHNTVSKYAQIFGAIGSSDTINGIAAATGVPLGRSQFAIYCTYNTGKWVGGALYPLGQLPPNRTEDHTGLSNWTWTAFKSPSQVFLSGTMTANKTVTLDTTNASDGMRVRFTRTGGDTGGPWTWSLGGLKTLAVSTWCDVVYDAAAPAWKLSACGPL